MDNPKQGTTQNNFLSGFGVYFGLSRLQWVALTFRELIISVKRLSPEIGFCLSGLTEKGKRSEA